MTVDMPRPRLPHLLHERNRHGDWCWYFRLGKGQRVRLRAPYGSPEFMAEYDAARAGKPIAPTVADKGTLGWLVERYRDSQDWSALALPTRKQREGVFKAVLATAGHQQITAIDRAAIVAGIDRRKATPEAARTFLKAVRGLFRWAVEAGHADVDPTMGAKVRRKKSDGFHFWTEEECQKYEARWPIGTRERLAFDVLLYTGLRRGDAVKVGRPHMKAGELRIRTEKTGAVVTLPILAPLARSIASGPCGDLTFIAGERGKPMVKESFGTWFRLACKSAGVPGRAHGLRKVMATRAVEAGATEQQLMALMGWSDPRTASIYTRKVNREMLAQEAGRKLALPRTITPVRGEA